MKRWACLVPILMLVWVVAASPQDPAPNIAKQPKMKISTSAELRKTLEVVIDLPDEFKQPVPFKLILKYVTDKVALTGGDFPIWVEPLTGDRDKDVTEDVVFFPPFVRRMSVDAVLRMCVSQLEQTVERPCVHLIRDGRIVITTVERNHPNRSLAQFAMVQYQATPIQRILDDLTDKYGVTIVVDSRSADVLTMPFSVRSNNDITVRGLLESIADSNDLRLVVDEHRVFLTSRASHLRRLRDRLEETELADKTRILVQGASPGNVPGAGGVGQSAPPTKLATP